MARKARSLDTLLAQVDALFPNRSKASDGWLGDTAHAARKSDHNPVNGVVHAIDITHDPDDGMDAGILAQVLVASRDPRIKYIIYNRRIISSKQQPWVWRPYKGDNAHQHHVHISVLPGSIADDTSSWNLSGVNLTPTETANGQPTLQKGDRGPAVMRLQLALKAHGASIDADGDFGNATKIALVNFQLAHGLKADGISGPNTNKILML